MDGAFVTGDRRITLAAPPPRPAGGHEAVMIGHCPGRADWQRLLASEAALARISLLGFDAAVRALRAIGARGGLETGPDDARLKALTNLPIPIASAAEFAALFPEAETVRAARASYLAGDRAWLPMAVADVFSRGERAIEKTLWVIRVDEAEGTRAFLPRPDADWFAPDPWRALGPLEIAMIPPRAGFLALPDLERLQLPARLRDLATLDLPRPEPAFLPCDADLPPVTEPDHVPDAPPAPAEPFTPILAALAGTLARVRPDLHLLLSLPFAPEGQRDRGFPAPSPEALSAADALTGDPAEAGLRQIQLLYPYLRAPDRLLASPAGVVLARMLESTARRGPWASVAGQPLSKLQRAHPPLPPQAAARLREDHGIGVLVNHGALVLDDERLTRPAFGGSTASPSGEISRFLGWLRRELRRAGERLVFRTDPDDPRPGLLLDAFFARLHAQGALEGRSPEDSYRITQRSPAPGTLLFEIEMRPAVPIDAIHVTLAEDRLDLRVGR
ncbi:MAG: hypothetical protein AAGI50_07795 [Pseudomonadota bacterium]